MSSMDLGENPLVWHWVTNQTGNFLLELQFIATITRESGTPWRAGLAQPENEEVPCQRLNHLSM